MFIRTFLFIASALWWRLFYFIPKPYFRLNQYANYLHFTVFFIRLKVYTSFIQRIIHALVVYTMHNKKYDLLLYDIYDKIYMKRRIFLPLYRIYIIDNKIRALQV